MIQLTDTAKMVIRQGLSQQKQYSDEKLYVRLSMGIGWGGPQLMVSLEERPLFMDQVIKVDDLEFVMNDQDLGYFSLYKLDYGMDSCGNPGFTLIPNF